MKKYLVLTLGVFSSILAIAGTNVIVVDGNYQGKNLYIQNPYGPGNIGFCIENVTVNGQQTTDEIQSTAFEIDFKALQLKVGDKVEIRITHKDDCKPKVINPEALKPKSTFDIQSIVVDKDMLLKWSAKSETGKLTYTVEQYRWNKWVKVGEVNGIGTPDLHDYSFKITPHSGKNTFRVKQIDYTGAPKTSKSVDYMSSSPELTFGPTKITKEINFYTGTAPAETMFEVYDQYGNIVKRGFGSKIDVSGLAKGSYYLSYDNKMGEFVKK